MSIFNEDDTLDVISENSDELSNINILSKQLNGEYINNIKKGCRVVLSIPTKKFYVDYRYNIDVLFKPEEYINIGIAYDYNETTHKVSIYFPHLLCNKYTIMALSVLELKFIFERYSNQFIKQCPSTKAFRRLTLEIPTDKDYYRFCSDTNIHTLYKDMYGIEQYRKYISDLKDGRIFLYKDNLLKLLQLFNGKDKWVKPTLNHGHFMMIGKLKVFPR